MKTAVLVFSDPKSGVRGVTRSFVYALATAFEYKSSDEDVSIYFLRAGTN